LGIKFKILNQNIPLAEKLRPKTLDEVLGQEHLTGKNGTIRKMLENDTLNSLIFWGPPGTGKTTLAEIISENSGRKFFKLSAVSSGVKDVREVIEDAKKQNLFRVNLLFYLLMKFIGLINLNKILCFTR
jgi:putative ATPase